MHNRVLLLEDDVLLSEILIEFLNEHHFNIHHCTDALEAMDIAYEQNFDIYLLDVMIPDGDGFKVLKSLREMGKTTPAIFITSLSSMQNLEQGYQSGCDDYIRKPFELEELLLRINVLLKRNFAHKNTDFEDFGNGVRFEFHTKAVYQGDRLLFLPKKEIKLLSIFVEKPNQFITQQEIFDELWGYDEQPSDMSLRVYIKNLRSLIGKDKIVNQRGNGYCYVK
ncbi:response regulator transcription factor [Helicobacter cappadocius]|uniref:Response regulator transcription factor n=1 Tax=Helicobacter cappadocius TaxID=3063998 RepID=A0AA90PL04_9HELI|nr:MULTISPECIES: response regulator transcription factor [unclassified Helicobacter]MDO7252991.1 response regulator transcription factor [Helicobacter sp. faydin-H75]MDP2539019.1 response regulator transcription factor [Helicobacter sp. faydin-H76]